MTRPVWAGLGAPTLGQLWLFLAVALPALAALLVPMPAVDLAYQLRAGAEILAGNGIPAVDTWTFTVRGQRWLDQQWGVQVILAAVFQLGGWTGLAILRAALVGLTFGILAWTVQRAAAPRVEAGPSSRNVALVTLAAFAVAAPALALRPQLFGIVLFALTLAILVDRSVHPGRLWLVPVIAVAWANLHGSFPLVLVLVGLAWLDDLLTARRAERRQLFVVGIVAALATLVTPFGLDAWRYVANLASNPSVAGLVSEWRPPSPLDPAGAVFYVSLLVAAGAVIHRVRADGWRIRRDAIAPLAGLVGFGAFAVLSGRGIAWWALSAPVFLVSLAPIRVAATEANASMPAVLARETRRSPVNGAVALALVLAAVALLPLWRPTGPAGVPAGTLSYAPQGIAAELNNLVERGIVEPETGVWGPQAWGSWLEHAVPNLTYAIDSRIELFPSALWDEAGIVARGDADWHCVLARQGGAGVVVVGSDQTALAAALQASSTWQLVYRDSEGSIWLRPASTMRDC